VKNKHKIVKKPWGAEVCIVNTAAYCGKAIVVGEQWSSGGKFHYHKIKDETFYVILGHLVIERENFGELVLQEGQSLRIKPGEPHRFRSASGKCFFIEFSTHHEDSDSYYGA
jgi:mannose-6-phosphate isomerase-like protein (cupin superfamily)